MNTYDLTELWQKKLSNVGVFGLCFHARANHTHNNSMLHTYVVTYRLSRWVLSPFPLLAPPTTPAQTTDFTLWWCHRFLNHFSQLIGSLSFLNKKPQHKFIHNRKSHTLIAVLDVLSTALHTSLLQWETAFWAAGEFFIAIPLLATMPYWKQG